MTTRTKINTGGQQEGHGIKKYIFLYLEVLQKDTNTYDYDVVY